VNYEEQELLIIHYHLVHYHFVLVGSAWLISLAFCIVFFVLFINYMDHISIT